MFRFASICTSGGVFEQGVISNGIQPIWGVEINPRVAEVYRLNYPHSKMVVADACTVDWQTLPRPDFLHASPSCRSFSQLNNKVEADKDIAVARAISKAIAHFLPDIFTLENVPKYQDSKSWEIILKQLQYLGYSVWGSVIKLKLWGVPQKQRNRFIAIATYQRPAPILLNPNRTKYWYEEIEDLISALNPSKLTNTQINKLNPKAKNAIALGVAVLLKRNQIRNYTPAAIGTEPYCWSVTATLATDQNQHNRALFADLVTPEGVFSLNVRCLARIQTIPDSYILPSSVAIAGLVVGDAIPPFFAHQMWEQVLKQVSSSEFLVSSSLREPSVRWCDAPSLINEPRSAAPCYALVVRGGHCTEGKTERRPPKGFDSSYNGGNLRNGLSHRVAERRKGMLRDRNAECAPLATSNAFEVGRSQELETRNFNGYLQQTQKKQGGKLYTEYYYRYYRDGVQRSQYVKKALIYRVREFLDSGKPIEEILILLRGYKIPYSQNILERESGENANPLSKNCRSKGEGTGYIICKPIKRNNKTYNQYWFCYEIWSNNRCQKKSKYIPQKMRSQVEKLNAEKVPVEEILKSFN